MTETGARDENPVVAVVVDRVPPWLIANFSAAGQLVELVAIEVDPTHSVDKNSFAGNSEDCFRRRGIDWSKERRASNRRGFARQVGRVLTDIKPDVVLMLGWYGAKNLAALRWCLANEVPSIATSDSNEHDYHRLQWREALKRRVVRLYSAGWAAGSLSARYLMRLGMAPERIVVGPVDTIDVSHFKEGAAKARQTPEKMRRDLGVPDDFFLAVSRFAPEKNLLNLIRGYHSYRDRQGASAWKLVLVGDGPMMGAVRKYVDDSGLGGWVHLPGWVTFEMLPAYYGLAGTFVHASTRDTWGVVVNEAMAAGLPVIVSRRCGSASELVHDSRNGFTFDPENRAELSELLWKIAHGECDRASMGQASQDIIRGWTPELYARSMLEAVNCALNVTKTPVRLADRLFLSLVTRWSQERQ